MQKIVIIALYPTQPWNRTHTVLSPEKALMLKNNADQQKLRSYWDKFVDLMNSGLTSYGFEVEKIYMDRWDITPENIETLDADLVFIPHTTHALFPTSRPVMFYMQVMQAWLFSVDPEGWSAASSKYPCTSYMEGNPDSGVYEHYQTLIRDSNESKFRQSRRLPYPFLLLRRDIPLGEYIFFPCQIPHDESVRYFCDHEEVEIIKNLSSWCNANKVHIVFKGHPVNLKSMKPLRKVAKGPYVRWSDASIHDLIRHSKAVYCINSGVGFEALLHEKPVVTFGRVEYDIVTHRANIDKLDDAWSFIKQWQKDIHLVKYRKFFDWFCRLYCFNLLDDSAFSKRLESFCTQLKNIT